MNIGTPLGVDQYSRFMIAAYDEREAMGVSTGFMAFFGNPMSAGKTLFSPDSEVVDIDILRGNRKIAALVNRGTDTKRISGKSNTAEPEFTTVTRKYPLIEETGSIGSAKLNARVPGEAPYMSMDKIQRMRWHGLTIHMEHIRRITRLTEYLASLSVLTGQHPAIFGTTNSDLIYDFQRSAGNTITPANTWNSGSQDILGDIDSACEQVRINGKLMPDMMVLGEDAMAAFLDDTTVQELADNRRFELIDVNSKPMPPKFDRFIASGMIPRGRLRTPSGFLLYMFSYLDSWETDAGTDTKYMPADEVLIASSNARADRYFGPNDRLPMNSAKRQAYQEYFGFSPEAPPMPVNVENMSAVLNPAAFYCDAYENETGKTLTVRTQCAPIFATTATDGFALLQNLIT